MSLSWGEGHGAQCRGRCRQVGPSFRAVGAPSRRMEQGCSRREAGRGLRIGWVQEGGIRAGVRGMPDGWPPTSRAEQ